MDYEQLSNRELDVLVAEKVMGLSKEQPRGIDSVWYWKADDGVDHKNKSWSPSTDISAAFEVVEKFGRDYYVKYDRKSNRYEVVIDYQVFNKGDGRPSFHFSRACEKTIPKAICIAALKTMEDDEE